VKPVADGLRMDSAMSARLQRNLLFAIWLRVPHETKTERPTERMQATAYRRA